MTKNLWRRGAIVAALVVTASIGLAPANAATAESPVTASATEAWQAAVSGPLDPDTFAGPVLVATPKGEVLTTVRAGELKAKAAEIRVGVAEGRIEVNAEVTDAQVAAGGCGDWQNANATPWFYTTSLNGCAVFGYPNYWRPYRWNNLSDVSGCVQAKGWSAYATPTVRWNGIGCVGGGKMSPESSVQWGNVLAYTQVQGMSASGTTGMAYEWWD